jgi:hypothetical protein
LYEKRNETMAEVIVECTSASTHNPNISKLQQSTCIERPDGFAFCHRWEEALAAVAELEGFTGSLGP